MYYYSTGYGIPMNTSYFQTEMIPNYIPYFADHQICYNPTFIFPIEEFLPN